MAVTYATLYPNSNRTETDNFGGDAGYSEGGTTTAAVLKDGNDATYDGFTYAPITVMNADMRVEWALDTLTGAANLPISQVVISIRNRKTGIITGAATQYYSIGGTDNAAVTIGTTATTRTATLTTDPGTGLAWTVAGINGYKWGWHSYVAGLANGDAGTTRVIEFSVQVQGPDPNTLTLGAGTESNAGAALSLSPGTATLAVGLGVETNVGAALTRTAGAVSPTLAAGAEANTGYALGLGAGAISLGLGLGSQANVGLDVAEGDVDALTLDFRTTPNVGFNLGGRIDFYNPGPFSGQDIATVTNTIPTPVDNANSAATGLQSKGCPYFAAVELADTQAGPDYGGAAAYQMVEIQAQFQSLPQQLVSPDEPHPLFSLTDGLTDQLWIGATPSGRLCGGDANNTLFSAPATLAADGQAHTLTFKLMAATQNLLPALTYTLAVDGGIVYSTIVQSALSNV